MNYLPIFTEWHSMREFIDNHMRIRFLRMHYSHLIASEIRDRSKDIKMFEAGPSKSNVSVEQSSPGIYLASIDYEDAMGHFYTSSEACDQTLDAFQEALDLLINELRSREISMNDGFIPSDQALAS